VYSLYTQMSTELTFGTHYLEICHCYQNIDEKIGRANMIQQITFWLPVTACVFWLFKVIDLCTNFKPIYDTVSD